MNISILASIWCKNLWDELILKNEIYLLEDKFKPKNVNFKVFSYDLKNVFFEKDNIKYKEYFPIWSKNIKNIFKNLYNYFSFINTVSWSDIVVIWWWWLIYDNEKQSVSNPLNSRVFRTNTIRFFRKKIIFYGIWLDIKYEKNLEKLKIIFNNAHEIYVRDNYSYNLLKKIWISSEVILDPVFNDNNKYNRNKDACIKKMDSKEFVLKDLYDIDFNWKKVWLAFRSWFFNKQTNKKLWKDLEILKIKEIIRYIQKERWEVILLPHSFHTTDKLANDFKFLIKCKIKWVKISNSMDETYNFYKNNKLDLLFAERLHSMILSEVYNIPFVWFMYWRKTKELLR